jgi:hypothetical protein
MRFLIILLSVWLAHDVCAQLPKQSIIIGGGFSGHGTGDLPGVVLDFSYHNRITRRLSNLSTIGSTIHYNSFITNSSTNEKTHETKAGIQVSSQFGFTPLKVKSHELSMYAGPLFRFQSTSNPRILQVVYSSNPGPYQLYDYVYENQNTISIGYLISINYTTYIHSKFLLGGKVSFQNDLQY